MWREQRESGTRILKSCEGVDFSDLKNLEVVATTAENSGRREF